MKKFACSCGKNVRDVFYKNGVLMCARCFRQDSESPQDFIINLLAAKGLIIAFQDEPVLVLKQFSADDLDNLDAVLKPNEDWVLVTADDFWVQFKGRVEDLRTYVTNYGAKKDDARED